MTRQVANAAMRGTSAVDGPRLCEVEQRDADGEDDEELSGRDGEEWERLADDDLGDVALLARRRSQVFQPCSAKNAKLVIPTM